MNFKTQGFQKENSESLLFLTQKSLEQKQLTFANNPWSGTPHKSSLCKAKATHASAFTKFTGKESGHCSVARLRCDWSIPSGASVLESEHVYLQRGFRRKELP